MGHLLQSNNIFFSCLIANYNNGKFLADCFESIERQTYLNIEVVIVDDCSTDDSWQIIEAHKFPSHFKLKRIKLDKNYGCGFAKRKCLDIATGNFAGFIDPDDTLENNAIEIMMKGFNNNLEVALISSKFNYVDISLNLIRRGDIGECIPKGESYLTYGKNAVTAFAAFNTTLYRETVGIDPLIKRAVDQDLYYKLEEVGEVKFIDEFLYNYRITSQSISANENGYKALYWHLFHVIRAAQKRRRNTAIQRLRYFDYLQAINAYYIWRIKIAGEKGQIGKKYYFVFQALLKAPVRNLFYLLKCIFSPNYC